MSSESSKRLAFITAVTSLLTAVLLGVFNSATSGTGDSTPATTLVPPPWKHTLGLKRVGQSHLDFYSGYRKKFSSPQGVCAVKLTFNDKKGPGDDAELTVYGVNSGTGELFYNTSMVSLGFFGRDDARQDGLAGAVGVGADSEGNALVADRDNNRIIRLRNEDNVVRFRDVLDFAESGTALRQPTGVAMEADTIYVADFGNDRIVVADSSGRFVRAIDLRVGLSDPFGIAVIHEPEWNFYGSRFIIVTDSLNKRISKIMLDGTPIERLRYKDISGGTGGFDFVAIDFYSNVYVTDRAGGCIYKFDRYLRYITRTGCGTGSKADLVEPRGITIYRRFGQVFVAERSGASYFWVGTDVRNLVCVASDRGERITLNVRFLLTEQSNVTIRLEDDEGKEVKTLLVGAFLTPGAQAREFHLYRSELPCGVADCDYVLSVAARPTYSSIKYHEAEKRAPVRPIRR
jgi:DNA-binding beta-propeller fold protein YncE